MPVEKLRLRPWLENALNSGRIPGVKWIDYGEKVFQVSWKHASRQGWSLDTDACIFKEWAIHTGRYHQTRDKPEPRRWKANFRCALNALPDIKELQARGVTRGNNAYKVYQMLTKSTDQSKDRAKTMKEAGTKADHDHAAKVLSKYRKGMMSTLPVMKRHSVIHKSSTVFHDSNSRQAICTTHPVHPQTLVPYWPTLPSYSPLPHMKDHDYLTTWYDPKPEMKDIGVMTYQEIKKEPVSPTNQLGHCCPNYDQDAVVALNDSHYINNVKEEKTVTCHEEIPSDQEIIDLVDRMSQDSDTSSDGSGSLYGDYNDQEQCLDDSPHSKDAPSGPLANLKSPTMHSGEYLMMFDYPFSNAHS